MDIVRAFIALVCPPRNRAESPFSPPMIFAPTQDRANIYFSCLTTRAHRLRAACSPAQHLQSRLAGSPTLKRGNTPSPRVAKSSPLVVPPDITATETVTAPRTLHTSGTWMQTPRLPPIRQTVPDPKFLVFAANN